MNNEEFWDWLHKQAKDFGDDRNKKLSQELDVVIIDKLAVDIRELYVEHVILNAKDLAEKLFELGWRKN